MNEVIKRSIFSGVIATICGSIAVFAVHLAGIPFTTFDQAVIAVAIASFFSAFFATFFTLKKAK
jgi:hypothetical protein